MPFLSTSPRRHRRPVLILVLVTALMLCAALLGGCGLPARAADPQSPGSEITPVHPVTLARAPAEGAGAAVLR